MVRHTLYIGLNDKDTKRQEVGTLVAVKIITNILTEKVGGGTIYEATGIYTHANGDIVVEPTLRVEIVGASANAVMDAVAAIKVALNQESVIVQTESIDGRFV